MSAHVLVSAAVSVEAIKAAAMREGWRAEEVETGLFKIVKVWIDGTILIEFLAREEADRYVDAFGASGMRSLDRKLRDLETKLADALLRKLPSGVLVSALGPDWAKHHGGAHGSQNSRELT